MAVDYVKVGTDLVVGAVAGAGDRLAEHLDENNEDSQHKSGKLAAGKKLPVLSRIGTYVNYGAPLVAAIAVFAGLSGNWATRAVTIGGQLTGRELLAEFTTKARPIPAATYTVWEKEKQARETGGGSPTPSAQGSELRF